VCVFFCRARCSFNVRNLKLLDVSVVVICGSDSNAANRITLTMIDIVAMWRRAGQNAHVNDISVLPAHLGILPRSPILYASHACRGDQLRARCRRRWSPHGRHLQPGRGCRQCVQSCQLRAKLYSLLRGQHAFPADATLVRTAYCVPGVLLRRNPVVTSSLWVVGCSGKRTTF